MNIPGATAETPSPCSNPSLRDFATSRENKTAFANEAAPNSEPTLEELTAIVVDCGYHLHVEAGAGLLETVYEVVLGKMLQDRGLQVEHQVPVPICLAGMHFSEGFKADIIVNRRLLLELKSVEVITRTHLKQVATHIRLLKYPLGLLMNFGAATFKEGIRRVVNNHRDFSGSRLRLNPSEEPLL